MKLPWKRGNRRKKDDSPATESTGAPGLVSISTNAPKFDGDLEDFTVLRHHAIRALCGAIMDRHTACVSPHPFCGPGHMRNGDTPRSLIAEVIPQGTSQTSGANLIGIYLCPATAEFNSEGSQDVMDWIVRMVPTQSAPNRKMAVSSPVDGVYQALYGPVLNTVEGDYSTGSIDPANSRPLRCDPEPNHCRWQYWENGLNRGDWLVPRFHCLQVFGEWWIVEVDRARGEVQQVAALDFADNPEHNFGIHSGRFKKGDVYALRVDLDGELAKVLQENGG